MDSEEHILRLGKPLGNIQSFEFGLRAALANRPGARPVHPAPEVDVLNFSVGAEVPESNLTDYASLRKLIELFNDEARSKGGALIDLAVVELRDALAHGRIYSQTLSFPLRLVKFEKPRAGKVRVAYSGLMDRAWFSKQMKVLQNAMDVITPRLKP